MDLLPTYEALASVVNLTLLDPELTNSQVISSLEEAKRYGISVATVRPCDADLAARVLAGSAVRVAAPAGYPYGFQSTAVKLYEVRDLLRRGAKEVGAVIAVSRLRSREFQHVQTELNQIADACRGEGAELTALFEVGRLTDELKIIAYTCCERAEAPRGGIIGEFTTADILLMRKHLADDAGVEAPAATLDHALAALQAGASRVAVNSLALLDEWKQRLATA